MGSSEKVEVRGLPGPDLTRNPEYYKFVEIDLRELDGQNSTLQPDAGRDIASHAIPKTVLRIALVLFLRPFERLS